MTKGFAAAKALRSGLLATVLPGLFAGQLVVTSAAMADQRVPAMAGTHSAESLEDPARELLLALSERPIQESITATNTLVSTKPAEPTRATAPAGAAARKAPVEPAVQPPAKTTTTTVAKPLRVPVAAAASSNGTVSNGTVDALRQELRNALTRVQALEQELDDARGQVAMAETEVTRLSAIVDSRNRSSLGKYSMSMPATRPAAAPAPARVVPAARPRTVDVAPPSSQANLKVATVSVEKADLRLGPGKNHSALMSVPKGSRLVVEVRQGEWYRVFAPNGERAWVHSGLVTFGDGASSLNDGSSVRVKGFDSNVEEEAFRRMQRITAGQ